MESFFSEVSEIAVVAAAPSPTWLLLVNSGKVTNWGRINRFFCSELNDAFTFPIGRHRHLQTVVVCNISGMVRRHEKRPCLGVIKIGKRRSVCCRRGLEPGR